MPDPSGFIDQFMRELQGLRDIGIAYGDELTNIVRTPPMLEGIAREFLGESALPREQNDASILDRVLAGAGAGVDRFEQESTLLGPVTRQIREAGEGARERQGIGGMKQFLLGAMVPGGPRNPKSAAAGARDKLRFFTGEQPRGAPKRLGDMYPNASEYVQETMRPDPDDTSAFRRGRQLEGPMGEGTEWGPSTYNNALGEEMGYENRALANLAMPDKVGYSTGTMRNNVRDVVSHRVNQLGAMRATGKSPYDFHYMEDRIPVPAEAQEMMAQNILERVGRGTITLDEARSILTPNEIVAREFIDRSPFMYSADEYATVSGALEANMERALARHDAALGKFDVDSAQGVYTRHPIDMERAADTIANERMAYADAVYSSGLRPAQSSLRSRGLIREEASEPIHMAPWREIEDPRLQEMVGQRIANGMESGAVPTEMFMDIASENEEILLRELNKVGIVSDKDWAAGGGNLQ